MNRFSILARLFCALTLLFAGVLAQAQIVLQTYPSSLPDYEHGHIEHIAAMPDGGYVAATLFNYDGPEKRDAIIRVDPNGTELWRYVFPDLSYWGVYGIAADAHGNSVIMRPLWPYQDTVLLHRFAPDGTVLDAKLLAGMQGNSAALTNSSYRVGATSDGGYVACGYRYTNGQAAPYIHKVDSAGDSLWAHSYPINDTLWTLNLLDVVELNDGGYLACGGYEVTASFEVVRTMVRVDAVGSLVWQKSWSTNSNHEALYSVIELNDGRIASAGRGLGGNPTIMQLTANGDTLWERQFGTYAFDRIAQTSDGNLLAVSRNKLYKVDLQGNEIWHRDLDPISAYTMHLRPDERIAIAGSMIDPVLTIIDSTGAISHSEVIGNVFVDHLNANCTLDAGEGSFLQTVELAGTGPARYTTTDSAGNYRFPNVLDDSYTLSVPAQAPYYATICQPDSSFNIAGADTLTIDFPLTPGFTCPYLAVDIGAARFRPCTETTLEVQYTNNGPYDAPNAYVSVTVPPAITPTSSSIAWNLPQLGNVYEFDLGTLDAWQQGTISIQADVTCNNIVLGQLLCLDAHIYPDSLCLDSVPGWDGSELDAEGDCDGDSVVFTLTNVSPADMMNHAHLGIVEDNLMHTIDSVKLDSSQSRIYKVEGAGKTWHLLSEQPDNHPRRSYTVATVEGCGTNQQGTFNVGFAGMFPEDDEAPYESVFCGELRGSWDPNDKSAMPQGFGEEHRIEPGQRLDYKIRFQNTGNDTAFRVVIRDTLSPFLYPGSVVTGSSSHPNTFRIYDSGILEWTFDPIFLPDSNISEPGSHGFVNFTVEQDSGIALGSVIENTAAIYFDFNPAVITNTTHHLVDTNFIALQVATWHQAPVSLTVVPNPMADRAVIQVGEGPYSQLQLRVYDLQGRMVIQQRCNGANQLVIQRGELAPGVYVFEVSDDALPIGTGKLVVR